MSHRRSSRILVDDPIDPIMTTLYELIAVATDVQDMTLSQLTAQPKTCEQLVQRVQNIGKAWDEHPDWHGRNWYVQVLLAIASLSRVVEWLKPLGHGFSAATGPSGRRFDPDWRPTMRSLRIQVSSPPV